MLSRAHSHPTGPIPSADAEPSNPPITAAAAAALSFPVNPADANAAAANTHTTITSNSLYPLLHTQFDEEEAEEEQDAAEPDSFSSTHMQHPRQSAGTNTVALIGWVAAVKESYAVLASTGMSALQLYQEYMNPPQTNSLSVMQRVAAEATFVNAIINIRGILNTNADLYTYVAKEFAELSLAKEALAIAQQSYRVVEISDANTIDTSQAAESGRVAIMEEVDGIEIHNLEAGGDGGDGPRQHNDPTGEAGTSGETAVQQPSQTQAARAVTVDPGPHQAPPPTRIPRECPRLTPYQCCFFTCGILITLIGGICHVVAAITIHSEETQDRMETASYALYGIGGINIIATIVNRIFFTSEVELDAADID